MGVKTPPNPSDLDREFKHVLGQATSSLRKALGLLNQVSKSDENGSLRRRLRLMRGPLEGALRILEGTGSIHPRWDINDPDLAPEKSKVATPKKVVSPFVPTVEE